LGPLAGPEELEDSPDGEAEGGGGPGHLEPVVVEELRLAAPVGVGVGAVP
jgi:hypothetical protein